MTKQSVISILIFTYCIVLPTWVLSFFPTPCGYGLCLLVYYPIIFLVGIISGLYYYKFSNRIKLAKWIQVVFILIIDFLLISYFYPKSEYHPFCQITEARIVIDIYEELEPTDIFEATEKRNFNLITANYHKFKLPKETYTVTYCFFDSTGSCDTTFKTYNYFVKDNKVFTDDTSIRFKLNFSEGSLTLIDKVQETNINLKVGYPNFGKYRSEYTGTSSESSNKGERITGLTKDIGNLRIMVYENLPKFEYKFERLFEKYLDRIK